MQSRYSRPSNSQDGIFHGLRVVRQNKGHVPRVGTIKRGCFLLSTLLQCPGLLLPPLHPRIWRKIKEDEHGKRGWGWSEKKETGTVPTYLVPALKAPALGGEKEGSCPSTRSSAVASFPCKLSAECPPSQVEGEGGRGFPRLHVHSHKA